MKNSSHKPDELFYCCKADIEQNIARLQGQEAIHCSSVLRYKLGDSVHFTDAESGLYSGQICLIKKGEVHIEIQTKQQLIDEEIPNYPILVCGILKNKDRLEWIIEKAVELGVKEIILVKTERSERAKVRFDRLELVALAAMKQSKRVILPKISLSDDLVNVISGLASTHSVFVAHEQIDKKAVLLKSNLVSSPVFVVGPEGGFSDEEILQISQIKTIQLISLGEWRLRAETACIQLLSLALGARLVN